MTRRWLKWGLTAVVVVALVVVLWNQGHELIDGEHIGWPSYLLVVALVFGDAVCPVLPGETTLNAASVLASTGQLDLWLVILCGAVGAVAGDSTVYWIARKAKGRVRAWLDRAADGKNTGKVVQMLHDRGPVLLLFGRYIPGVRFALNVALGGVVRMPYRHFVGWSALSGTLWSTLTCLSAYTISNALAGYPVVSLVLTCLFSTVLIAMVIWVQRQWSRHHPRPAEVDAA